MAPPGSWRLRARTAEAMLRLLMAWLLVNKVQFKRWRTRLDHAPGRRAAGREQIEAARRLAVHVERGAARLPLTFKCLPRALALSAMLRARGLPHQLVIAARPADLRGQGDDLHAWIDIGDKRVLGDLPGAWVPILVANG